jgi:hypothetical protein
MDRLTGYLEWAGRSMRSLHNRIAPSDIDRLILTPGYHRLLSTGVTLLASSGIGVQRVVNDLISTELQHRTEELDEVIHDLRELNPQWCRDDLYAVLDTCVYIEHDQKLREIDLTPLLSRFHDKRLHIIMPMTVMDELDGLKKRGDRQARWRAGYTLAIVEDIFSPEVTMPGLLRERVPDVRGAVDMEILYDPPGHVRLPVNDDEIIDRALAAQSLAGQPVTLVTFDSGPAFKARRAGLKVLKIATAIGDEPEPGEDRKAKRQQQVNGARSADSTPPG